MERSLLRYFGHDTAAGADDRVTSGVSVGEPTVPLHTGGDAADGDNSGGGHGASKGNGHTTSAPASGRNITGLPLLPLSGFTAGDVAHDIRQAIADMTSVLGDLPAFHRDVDVAAKRLVTPRAIARIMHGISTPLFSAMDWRRHR